jgi:hypothetical protein
MIVSDKISVFPNPVHDNIIVQVDGISGVADIRLFDMYGKMVIQQRSGSQKPRLDMSKLPAGVYLIKIKDNKKESSVKVIKE